MLFDTDEKKCLLKAAMDHAVETSGFLLHAWAILSNHLHLLLRATQGPAVPRFVARLTGRSAIELNRLEGRPGRRVWYQYWDRCIRNEADLYTRLNYIHHNCVKHGHAKDMGSYRYSSYGDYVQRYGLEWVQQCFSMYPIVDFTPEDGME
jgi:REP element-mobilizing transposase RayT